MAETLDDYLRLQPPTPERPLLGRTILAVDDSRYASEALRLICQRTGARIRRADSLAAAARHLCAYRPHVAVIDVGLPDGSGLDLVRQLAAGEPRIEAIISVSGEENNELAARAAGADAFLSKPIVSVAAFVKTVVGLLPGSAPPELTAVGEVLPDRIALKDDLSLAAELLRSDPDPATLDYLGGFLAGLAKSTEDHGLTVAIGALARAEAQAVGIAISCLAKLVSQRLNGEALV